MTESEHDLLPDQSPHHGFRGDAAAVSIGEIPTRLTIAVSRESGARGGTIGRRVGRRLDWQVYDQELLEYMLNDVAAQQSLFDNVPEPEVRWVEGWLRTLEDSHAVKRSGAVEGLLRLTLTLGAQGWVVLVGRGAGYLLPRPSTLHVRLVAPLEDRIAYMCNCLRLSVEEARQRVRLRDTRRSEFLATFLRERPAEAHTHDLILNTSSLGEETCTELIVQAARAKEATLADYYSNL
jgi:hypothetical protein